MSNYKKSSDTSKGNSKRHKKTPIPREVINEILSKVKVSYTVHDVGSCIRPEVAAYWEEQRKKREQS